MPVLLPVPDLFFVNSMAENAGNRRRAGC